MNDLISRQAAINAIRKDMYADKDYAASLVFDEIEGVLKALPTAERKGHWKNAYALTEYMYRCSECFANHRARYDYCPSCGARMERE